MSSSVLLVLVLVICCVDSALTFRLKSSHDDEFPVNGSLSTKIIGGVSVARGGAPWQVGVQHTQIGFCGGVLIGPATVLTAAHCVYGVENSPSKFLVRYGTLDIRYGTDASVVKVIRHSRYSDTTHENDVAILHLSAAFSPGTNAAIIPLATSMPSVGSSVNVTGWGQTTASSGGTISNYLQLSTKQKIVSNSECAKRWSGVKITSSMICAHDTTQSSCMGDSGGPLTQNGLLIGVVSFGYKTCLHDVLPNVYASVPNLVDWIQANSGAMAVKNSVMFPFVCFLAYGLTRWI